MTVHCHKLVAQTAKEMAGALYEEVMRDNTLWANWKAQCPDLTPPRLQAMFIELMWPKLIEQARATLAKLLATPLSESLKQQITDALIKDNTLMRGRKRLHTTH